MMTSGTCKSGYHIFDSPSEDVSVVRKSSGKGRAIVENILRPALTAPQLLFESVSLLPELKDRLLLRGQN